MSIKTSTTDGISLCFKQSMFPDGGNYVQISKDCFSYIGKDKEINIEWIYNGDGELVQLFLVVDAIRRINKDIKLNLDIPYFPGARQDRVCEDGEAFNLKVYANLINSLNFNKVTVFDPHSDVTGALVDNIKIIDNSKFVIDAINSEPSLTKNGCLVSPDAGANKKVYKLAAKLKSWNLEVIRADKQRNTNTHEIIGTVVYGDVKDKVCFVIDDIGSGCNTFIKLAKRLKEMGADKVILILSHWEGGANIENLKDSGINKVYIHNNLGDSILGKYKEYIIEI